MKLSDFRYTAPKSITAKYPAEPRDQSKLLVLDRKTGELLSAEKYGPVNWADHVDMKTGRPVLSEQSDFSKHDRLIYPNPNGDHDWMPISYSPKTGLAYIPATDVPWIYSTYPGFRYFYDLGGVEVVRVLGALREAGPVGGQLDRVGDGEDVHRLGQGRLDLVGDQELDESLGSELSVWD